MPRPGEPIHPVHANGQVRWKVYVSLTRGGKRTRLSKTFDSREEAERYYAQSKLADVLARTRDSSQCGHVVVGDVQARARWAIAHPREPGLADLPAAGDWIGVQGSATAGAGTRDVREC